MASYDFAKARKHVERMINYHFQNPDLLEEALYTGGPTSIGGKLIDESNKRIAMVGDRTLDLVLNTDSWEKNYLKGISLRLDVYTRHDADEILQVTQTIATNANLGRVGREKQLHLQLAYQAGMRMQDVKDSMIATALEAVIGAVCVDSGDMKIVKAVVVKLGLL